VVRAAREANAAMPEYTVGLLEAAHGDLSGQRVVILGAAYRGGVKETAFSGVFAVAESLNRRGAIVLVQDPLFTDAELAKLHLTPYHLGEKADAAVVQTDHAEYRTLGPDQLPGIRTVVDGRRSLDASLWDGVTLRLVGAV